MIEGNKGPEEFDNRGYNLPEIEFNLGGNPKDYSNFLDLRQSFDGMQPEVSVSERERELNRSFQRQLMIAC